MKKILALLLACAMVLSLAACGSAASTVENAAETAASAADAAAETAASAAETAADATAETAASAAENAAETAEEAAETVEEAAESAAGTLEEAAEEAAPAGEGAEPLEAAEINVFIAASLDNAVQEIVALYNQSQPNVAVTLNADSSGTLLTQIQEGFTCDIFFSAAVKQIKTAEEEGLSIEGTRVDLLKNTLDLITWKGSGTAVTGLENLSEAKSMALADGSVPAGKYTRAALQALGILDGEADPAEITTAEVSEALGGLEINETSNVSKTLEAVAEGSNEVGTVYHSDAYSRMEDIEILESVSTDLTGEILYPMIRVQNPDATEAVTAAAEDFYQFLQTDEVMAIFERYMFIPNK